MTNTQAILLGTGTPNVDPERFGPSVAILVEDIPYLVDFGPGVVRRAAAACQNGVDGLAVENLCTAFLTHLHSDHTIGYPDLIFTPWVLERRCPVRVFGPSGLQAMTEHILAAYQADIRERLEGLEPAGHAGYQVHAEEIEAGVVYQDDRVCVEAFAVNHGSWPAFGYRFETGDGVIVISGDTAPYGSMLEDYAGCDLLIHEVYSHVGFSSLPLKWQRYHAGVHTSTRELAQIAAQVRPGLLVLYHQLFLGETEADLVREIQETYPGPVVSGKDLDIFEINELSSKR